VALGLSKLQKIYIETLMQKKEAKMFFALWMELMFMIYGTVLAQKQMAIFHQKIWHYGLAVFFVLKV
jgi:hypothetical protein